MQADAFGGDRREGVNFFVADGMAFGDGLPVVLRFIPNFNSVVLDVLAIVEPFHGEGAGEGRRLGKLHFEDSGVRSGSGPEGVGIAVKGNIRVAG